jgi:hypothetical protein
VSQNIVLDANVVYANGQGFTVGSAQVTPDGTWRRITYTGTVDAVDLRGSTHLSLQILSYTPGPNDNRCFDVDDVCLVF